MKVDPTQSSAQRRLLLPLDGARDSLDDGIMPSAQLVRLSSGERLVVPVDSRGERRSSGEPQRATPPLMRLGTPERFEVAVGSASGSPRSSGSGDGSTGASPPRARLVRVNTPPRLESAAPRVGCEPAVSPLGENSNSESKGQPGSFRGRMARRPRRS